MRDIKDPVLKAALDADEIKVADLFAAHALSGMLASGAMGTHAVNEAFRHAALAMKTRGEMMIEAGKGDRGEKK